MGPQLNDVSALVTMGTENAELLNTFFASVFTAEIVLQESLTLEI